MAWYVFGGHILPPSHTGWMLRGTLGPDPVQYWLGYTFFKHAPWTWPPGLNPAWGLEVSSSIFYADSIPLLAIFFKAISGLAEVSQYWGLWIFACAGLQGALAWRLIGQVTRDPLARLAGAVLFIMQPALLTRMGGHFALSAHFLLLAGLWLCIVPGTGWRRTAAWAPLVAATAMIHSYLLPMVLGLWAADWLARGVARHGWRGLAAEALAVPVAGLAALWAAGFFVLTSGFGGQGARYGQMQMDLLAPFDPGPWGAILPDLPGPLHAEVGASYPGLGILALLLLSGIAWLWRPLRGIAARWPLLLALGVMLAVAISHHVSIGGREVGWFELPPRLADLAAALRASERFLWPLGYALLLAGIAALAHAIGGRRAGVVLALLVGLQFIDLQPGFTNTTRYFPQGPAVAPLRLTDPFWAKAAARYTRIRVVPNGNQAKHWEEVAVYAATLGLETDAVYLARIDPGRVAALNADMAERLASGRHEPGTLYVLGDDASLARARRGAAPERDALLRRDGVWVLAPGWWLSRPLGPVAAAGTPR
ncbi:DUF6311 domain-containing protein [Humitalea sp. 24SJ18S-53]|uniref:DUF6311 domain-containing protein n=1 Tax=Humitalea sp. 24SJ18S-53 TaxID=3422307 RepID=UPI003D67F2C9